MIFFKIKAGTSKRWPLLFAAALVFPAAPAAAIDMVEGQWETVSEMVMEGMPYPMPPTTMTQCITKEDMVPGKDEKGDCKVSEQRVSGNTVRWKAVCKDKEGTSESTGEITYTGKTYKGTTRMVLTERNGQSTTMTVKLSGRHLGPCTGRGTTVNGMAVDDIERQMRGAQEQQLRQAEAEQRRSEAELRRQEEERRARERAEAEARQTAGRDYTSRSRADRDEADKSLTGAAREAVEKPARAIRGLFGL